MKYFTIVLLIIYLILNIVSIILQKENKKKAVINFIASTICVIAAIICVALSK